MVFNFQWQKHWVRLIHLFNLTEILSELASLLLHSQWLSGCCHYSNYGSETFRPVALLSAQSSGLNVTPGGLSHPCTHLLPSRDRWFGTRQCRLCCGQAHLASISKHPNQLGEPEGHKKFLLNGWHSVDLTLTSSRGWPGCSRKPSLCLEQLNHKSSPCANRPPLLTDHWSLTTLKLSLLFLNHQFSWKI